MRKSRFTDEQIVGFLKQAEAGMPVKELCRQGGFSDATFYKWRSRFGGMEASEAQRLRDLEAENNRLSASGIYRPLQRRRNPATPRVAALSGGVGIYRPAQRRHKPATAQSA